jgi:hypothetical protein
MSALIEVFSLNSATGNPSTATAKQFRQLLTSGGYLPREVSHIVFQDTGRIISSANITYADGKTQNIWVLNEKPSIHWRGRLVKAAVALEELLE